MQTQTAESYPESNHMTILLGREKSKRFKRSWLKRDVMLRASTQPFTGRWKVLFRKTHSTTGSAAWRLHLPTIWSVHQSSMMKPPSSYRLLSTPLQSHLKPDANSSSVPAGKLGSLLQKHGGSIEANFLPKENG